MSSAQGIDVSSFQPVLTSTFGKSFIFAKATEGLSWRDPHFAANWAFLGEQVKAGKIAFRGAYHFFHPGLDPAAQAAFFLSAVRAQGLNPGDVLMSDSEILSGMQNQLLLVSDRSHLLLRGRHGEAITRAAAVAGDYAELSQGAHIGTMTAMAVDAANREFLDALAAGGGPHCHVVNYSDLSVASQLPSCTKYPLFVAYYSLSAPASVAPWPKWVFWQWAGGGGPTGADQDAFNGDEDALKAWADSVLPAPAPAVTYLTETETEAIVAALPVLTPGINDDHLPHWYVRRVQTILNDVYGASPALRVDGDYGPKSQGMVKTLIQARYGIKQTAIVDKATWTALVTAEA